MTGWFAPAGAVSRRCFLSSAGALLGTGVATPLLGRPSWAATPAPEARRLTVERRQIEVLGRSAEVYGLRGPNGRQGLFLEPGELFDVELYNALDEPTIVHWHGQEPPPMLDGGPLYFTLEPGSLSRWTFEPRPGTHWMHSHHGTQEIEMMSAPLIVRGAEEAAADRQEVVVLLNDFSFTPPGEILKRLEGGTEKADSGGAAGSGMGGMSGMHAGHQAPQGGTGAGMASGGMAGMDMAAMDLNDIEFDAYLANYRTLEDPEVHAVERGGRLRLRLINASAGTNYFVDLGALSGELVAIDGNPTRPLAGSRFPLAVAQRLDLLVDLPAEADAWPVLFLREGERQRSGVVLATAGAAVPRLALEGEEAAGPLEASDLLTHQLRPLRSLAERAVDRRVVVELTGDMEGYRWGVEPRTDDGLLRVCRGERVVLVLDNKTGMAHPMHLHGHHFQLVAVGGEAVEGPLMDTVLVPANGSVSIAFDAVNPGRWPLHCHLSFHMEAGMITTLDYAG